MPKYVTRLAFVQPTWDGWGPNCTADTCQELDKSPVKTGLLDMYGAPVYRLPNYGQLGFEIPKK